MPEQTPAGCGQAIHVVRSRRGFFLMAIAIPKLKFSEPRHNLPGRKGVATAEDRFTIAFARAYLRDFSAIHRNSGKKPVATAREIPVNGYGIADLIVVCANPGQIQQDSVTDFVEQARPSTRAFECKLNDWRGALIQAVRYRYFAHQAIVILPPPVCARALDYIDTFRRVKVGLWSYDADCDRIHTHHTPRPAAPKSSRYHLHSIQKVLLAARSLPIR